MKSCLKNIFAAIFMAAVIVFAYLTVYQKGNSGAEESELINIFLFLVYQVLDFLNLSFNLSISFNHCFLLLLFFLYIFN